VERSGDGLCEIVEFNDDFLEVGDVCEQVNFFFDDIKCLFIRLRLLDPFVDYMTVQGPFGVATT
jgi:hypothetical protein